MHEFFSLGVQISRFCANSAKFCAVARPCDSDIQKLCLRPKISNPSGSAVSTMFCKAKSATTKKIARRFVTIFKQKCSSLRPLLSITFPQGFPVSKNIGHPTSGNGGKKTFKRYLRSEQTNTQTDRQTHRQTDGHFDLQRASTQRANALKIMKRSGLRFEHFCLKIVTNRRAFFFFFFADFALQNMVETTLPDGLETSGQRAYR